MVDWVDSLGPWNLGGWEWSVGFGYTGSLGHFWKKVDSLVCIDSLVDLLLGSLERLVLSREFVWKGLLVLVWWVGLELVELKLELVSVLE